MTFSIAGVCEKTAQIGCAVATSSMAVGARVGRVLAGKGVVFSQARTDPRLHSIGLAALKAQASANVVLEHMKAAASQPQWRQLGVLTANGEAAHHTGVNCMNSCGGAAGENCLALGNFLANEAVLDAMVSEFEGNPQAALADRLIASLRAGEAAGGECDPLRSSALLVFKGESFAWVDLRCDDDKQPVVRLAALWREFSGKADAYTQRALDPGNAPDSHDIER